MSGLRAPQAYSGCCSGNCNPQYGHVISCPDGWPGSKCETPPRRLTNVGPTSQTLARHWSGVRAASPAPRGRPGTGLWAVLGSADTRGRPGTRQAVHHGSASTGSALRVRALGSSPDRAASCRSRSVCRGQRRGRWTAPPRPDKYLTLSPRNGTRIPVNSDADEWHGWQCSSEICPSWNVLHLQLWPIAYRVLFGLK